MKIITMAVLVTLPFLFGCASTTVKTFSADFKVYPVETENVGKTFTLPEGETYTIHQQYMFECILKETTQSPRGETTTKIVSSPKVTTAIGYEAKIGVVEEGTEYGSMFKVKLEDLGSEYKAYLESTIKEAGSEPVTCSQTIT
jgi:hypothetical protein